MDGRDDRVRRVPRPQVRPLSRERLLLDESLLLRYKGDRPDSRSRSQGLGREADAATPEQEQHLAKFDDEITAVEKGLKQTAKQLQERRWEWEDQTLAAHKAGKLAWKYQQPLSATASNGATLTVYKDEPVDANFYLSGSVFSEGRKKNPGLIVASGANPDNETYLVKLRPGAGNWTALGIDVQQDESLPGNRVSRGADRFVVTEVEAEIGEGPNARKLPFILANSTEFGEPVEHTAMAAIDGDPQTGWGVGFGEHRNPFLALRFKEPVRGDADTVITVRIRQDSTFRKATIGRFRVAMSDAHYSAPETGDSNQKRRMAPKDSDVSLLAVATDQGVPPAVLKYRDTEEDAPKISRAGDEVFPLVAAGRTGRGGETGEAGVRSYAAAGFDPQRDHDSTVPAAVDAHPAEG